MSRKSPSERAAVVAAMRAQRERKDRQRKYLIFGTTAAISLALIAATAVPLIGQARRTAEIEAAAEAPIDGVERIEPEAADHVTGPVEYQPSPPSGGDHAPGWQNCGVYTEPVNPENAVHSLEHGAVWITYSPDVQGEQLEALTNRVEGKEYALVSPHEGLQSPIMLSAWGVQLAVEDVDDPRIDIFLAKYLQGPQTPEPGAACTGSVGSPPA